MMSICNYGGEWKADIQAGIALRHMADAPTGAWNGVASSNM